ncbi:unnamed protein product [Sphagnum troendelagicum]|uniref:Uncharacterized protein n=1 Tax=Sphagnum jensenii TaxID=128206 RepID=A0ABP0XMU0_9BRYO
MEKEKQKESSRRSSWPWKRKSSEKVAAANSFAPHEGGGTFLNSSAAAVEDRQQSEERVKSISEQLANALADITTKDNLVKQHVKVTEEAVSGWEKAEAEAVALKQQLDAAWQQKLATEDRATHLDGALKECMKQLRHVREEQEQLIHDTLVKKTREYDKVRIEMETKLAEASEILSHTRTELLECRAEGKALSHALQERSRSLAELGEAKGRAEADIKILQVQVEAMEKENANLKYEVHVLNKELEIRNGQREYEHKAADIAAKKHLESVKKIAQLEEECSRLRLLIRKKLPGPAALQRMRNEVEGFGKPVALENKGRRSFGRSASHLDPVSMGMMKENAHDPGYNSTDGIAERMAAMDEEMKMLREALACRNEELQNAHIRCVKTANRLSLVEEELDKARGVQSQSKQQEIKALIKESPHSMDEISQDASSDTWASSLVATPDQFKKEKSKPQSNGNIDNRQASLRFELMDDFVEMEQLAKMSEPAKSDNTYSDTASFDGPRESPMTTASDQIQELEVELASTRRELESANNTICDLNAELATAKELLRAFQSRNSANEVVLHGDRGQIAGSMQWKDSELENAMQSLVLVGNKLLQGKSDMVYFISELGLTLERIMSLKPFEIPSQGTKCEYDSAVAEQHAAGGAAARMNLNALQSVSLLPNREIKAAGRRSPLKDELPRTWPRFLGAGAGETVHLRTEKGDIEDHLKAADKKVEQLKLQEKERGFPHEIHQEREDTEIAAAALAECQRTILALGRQLSVMGTVPVANQKATETSVSSSTDSATSIQKLTENMDFFQWQKEAEVVVPCFPDIAKTHNHSPSALREQSSPWVTTGGPHPKGNQSPLIIPGRQQNEQQGSANQSFYGQQHGENDHRFRNDYLDHGAGTMSPSLGLSDFSGHGLMSVPASPARSPSPALWSIRMRTNNGPKSSSEDSVLEETPAQKPRTPSSFSRFYSRSRSGSSGSSS